MSLSETEIKARIEARKQRWVDLYDPARAGMRVVLVRYMPELPERPWPHLDNAADRVEWAWRKYQLQMQQLEWLDDDTLPFLDVYTGTEIFAAAFGCKTYYPENDMPFAMPCIRSGGAEAAEAVAALQIPSLDVPPIRVLFEMAEELRRRAGPDALVHLVDIQTPMDISALIWDKTQFYPALIQQPEVVRQLAHKVQTFMVTFLDAWFARFGREFIAHYPDYYMPYGITLSEDEVGAVSGRMFNNLFLPELTTLSNRYGAMGMHCCAHARHQWENWKKIPNLKLLNLVQPPEVTREAWGFFAGHTAQFHNYQGEGSAETWREQHPPEARMVYEVFANSKEEAIEIASCLKS